MPKVNINDAMRGSIGVDVEVVGVNRAKFRIWCAKKLIQLACWIINYDVTFKGNV